MKKFFSIFFLTLCGASFGQNVPFQHLGHFFNQTNIELVWSASTNDLPRKLGVYEALPSEISPTVISNLVALGSFAAKDRKQVPDNLHIISYADPAGKRGLLINTEWSFIDYRDSDANDMHIVEGVPNKQQAFEIATNWLPRLGIDRDQLVKKPHSSDLQVHGGEEATFFYKKSGDSAYATNISMFDVTFKRSLDGVEISGGSAHGGYNIEIGHHAKISRILVSWRKYTRAKLYSVATPETLMKWIREGKAVWYAPDAPDLDWPSIKKMVVTKVTPYYYSDAYGVDDKPQNWACPFAELETKVGTDQTNVVIFLDCPIIDITKP
jgi:hypothetical protein